MLFLYVLMQSCVELNIWGKDDFVDPVRHVLHGFSFPRERDAQEVPLHVEFREELKPDGDLAPSGRKKLQARNVQYRLTWRKTFRRAGRLPSDHTLAEVQRIRLLRLRPIGRKRCGRDLDLPRQRCVRVPVLREHGPHEQPRRRDVQRRGSTTLPERLLPATLVPAARLLRLSTVQKWVQKGLRVSTLEAFMFSFAFSS
ncbi:MAG: hypothetical protein COX80_01285 [Candidatus Magasanikbacteria bacterium CG_4_10_14_0_2_um_filter_33_14]|uniref:Uncharacterized protein n=1 Tax=Candidatus Magasanikbacteria bacterium CG_4_10_14_0_2_um_filter_33_14 TaxID=1974636 RepID=A0A2M7VBE9_9BACT|nr:MAG: hypothetical protein COX80_01285 [Candidatus Magasanikbacteria bacterium CG_4_10_14_0_2_um_filter_33_14]